MKKLLMICILIVTVIFISGCTNEEKTETPMSSQNSQESDTEPTGSILKSSDVPGLALKDFNFISAPKSSTYTLNSTVFQASVEETTSKEIPLGNRNVGQDSTWEDKIGRSVGVTIKKFDSNDGIEQSILLSQSISCDEYAETKRPGVLDMGCGSPNIGDYSVYTYSVAENSPDVENVNLFFVHGNYCISIQIVDEKEKSLDEAIRIAKIVKSRLD